MPTFARRRSAIGWMCAGSGSPTAPAAAAVLGRGPAAERQRLALDDGRPGRGHAQPRTGRPRLHRPERRLRPDGGRRRQQLGARIHDQYLLPADRVYRYGFRMRLLTPDG
ncbi:MAG: hypothetical protein M5U09_26785 [Gammaproteobacteria bacterium]|nr:hypothetical protein [Gammaproteobacteria bacterium]